MGHLLDLGEKARRQSASTDAHFHGGLLLRAIDDFAASIVGRFRVPGGGSTREVLCAYADDHGVGAGGQRAWDTGVGEGSREA